MDKRLINADRLLTYISSIRNAHIEKRNEGDECDQFANEVVIDWLYIISNDIEKGVFDADPIPLPTIKPGDKTHSAGWYCPTCNVSVSPHHVTYQEDHDVRFGGCGGHVEWLEVSHD